MSSYLQDNTTQKLITIPSLHQLKAQAEKIAMLTCYDASFAALMERCGADVLLIGDSLGMVCQGHSSTLPVKIDDMAYHTANVARGSRSCLVITDMPFGSYATPESAMHNAMQLIQAGAHMVKIEGGSWLVPTIRFLTERSVPVCAHIGLTPQSVLHLGGYKVQGKTASTADMLKSDAKAVEAAGASLLVLEAIPNELALQITDSLTIPTIGIGAGPHTSGQVLVMHDMLGVYPGKKARFVRNFMEGQTSIDAAFRAYVAAVKDGSFPSAEHCF